MPINGVVKILDVNSEGDFWIKYLENEDNSERVRNILVSLELQMKYRQFVKYTPLSRGDVEWMELCVLEDTQNHFSRVGIKNHVGSKVRVEFVDRGGFGLASPALLVPIDEFNANLAAVPALALRVRHVGVKSLHTKPLQKHLDKTTFSAQMIYKWIEPSTPCEMRLSFPELDDDGNEYAAGLDVAAYLQERGCAVAYTKEETQMLNKKRVKYTPVAENSASNKHSQASLKSYLCRSKLSKSEKEKIERELMDPFERLKGPFNGTHGGIESAPWLDLSVPGENPAWSRREVPLNLEYQGFR